MAERIGPSDFVDEAYHLENDADKIEFYRKWAEDYDRQMLEELSYVAPFRIAQSLASHLPDPAAEIFDIGCGTGLTCVFLAQAGYTRLDGIDLSPDMVRVAGERGIYRELLVGDATRPLARENDSYHGVISSGTFTHGHVGPEPLAEIFRILKPGGYLACTVHDDLWESMGFRQSFESLVERGVAECLQLELDRYFDGREPEGRYCVYRKRD